MYLLVNRILIIFIFFSCLSAISCKKHQKSKSSDVGIIIEYSRSSRLDLAKKTYTVFYFDKKPKSVSFTLTKEEEKKITEEYRRLALDKLPDSLFIEDSCFVMPKLYTTIIATSKKRVQKIVIDPVCHHHDSVNSVHTRIAMRYIKFIERTILKKKEINEFPKSNMGYM